jgi:polysaccharide pyruvyl transferase WcaK-like protein
VGAKYVLWGASVGKFEKNPKALAFFKKHLKLIDAIVVRENVSYEYLKSLGLDETLFMAPDPAFSVPCGDFSSTGGDVPLVGINLSPHSALYIYSSQEEAMKKQCDAIVNLIDRMHCRVVLLPHVISRDEADNDLCYMSCIKELLPLEYRDKVELVDDDPGFVGLKNVLAKCDYVIAARMHCAINAICVGVPTLFLSYSEKAKGMSEFVYGNGHALLSLPEFENTELVAERLLSIKVPSVECVKEFDYKNLLTKRI